MAGEGSIRPDGIVIIPSNGGLDWQQSWEEVDKSGDTDVEDFTGSGHWVWEVRVGEIEDGTSVSGRGSWMDGGAIHWVRVHLDKR